MGSAASGNVCYVLFSCTALHTLALYLSSMDLILIQDVPQSVEWLVQVMKGFVDVVDNKQVSGTMEVKV